MCLFVCLLCLSACGGGNIINHITLNDDGSNSNVVKPVLVLHLIHILEMPCILQTLGCYCEEILDDKDYIYY